MWRTCLEILSSESVLWRTRSGDLDEVREKLILGCSFSERSCKTSQHRLLAGGMTERTHHSETLRTLCDLQGLRAGKDEGNHGCVGYGEKWRLWERVKEERVVGYIDKTEGSGVRPSGVGWNRACENAVQRCGLDLRVVRWRPTADEVR